MVKVKDGYGNDLEGKITKVGRKYVYVDVNFTGHVENIPFERLTGRTAQGYEERYNAIPMFLQK